jgi:menaquinol-cytochrome c reductase iron-sulfur subunit
MTKSTHNVLTDDPTRESKPPRRRFLLGAAALLAGLAGAAAGIPILSYVLDPLLRRRSDRWIRLGKIADFSENRTRLVKTENPLRKPWDGDSGKLALYVRRLTGEAFQVFSVHCTHLGCPVTWFPQSGLFLCPCHGGVFYADGSRASGPPPRGLYQLRHKIQSGELLILAGHLPTLQEPH